MAINPSVAFPGRITAPSAAYPYGSSKDETAPGAGDGTPYQKLRADDIFGYQQALLSEAAIVPNGSADSVTLSQYKNAAKVVFGGAGLYQVDIDYPIDSYAKGSDGLIYRALAANGPASSVVDPVGNPATWEAQAPGMGKIQTVGASVAANALTVTLDPTTLDFRDATLSSGAVNTRVIPTQLSLTVPSGATLGTVNGGLHTLVILAIDNAGTIELAIVNLAGGTELTEKGVISTVAIDATADLDDVIYSDTSRSNVPYRVVEIVRSTQATAGTWATAPSLVQGAGGIAVSDIAGFGVGQKDVDVSGIRSYAVTYYNTSDKVMWVTLKVTGSASGQTLTGIVDGITKEVEHTDTVSFEMSIAFPVPPGLGYLVNHTGLPAVNTWRELK